MVQPPPAPRWGRFSTASLPRGQQLRAWHQFVQATFVDVQVLPDAGDAFQASADFGEIDGLRLGAIHSPRSLVAHRRVQRADEPCFMLHLQEQGVCLHQQGRHSTALCPGEFSLSDMSRPYRLETPDDTHMLIAVLPARALEARVPGVHDLVCHAVRRDLRATAALAAVLRSVLIQGASLPAQAPAEAPLDGIVLDLVAAALRPLQSQGVAQDVNPDAQHRRWLRVEAYIEDRLGDAQLGLSTIARDLGLSPRQLQRVFADQGTTLTLYLQERRLLRAQRQLRGATGRLSITQLAFDSGFSDASYFGQVFRRRFGCTPSQVRAQSMA